MTVSLTERGASRVLTVERPHARNALDTSTIDALVALAKRCKRDPAARVIVIAASPPTFIAGGDLREFGALVGARGGRAVARKGRTLIQALRSVSLPLVAAIDGDAYGGGCELAAACDVRFARASARFHWVQNRLAVTTGWGATERLLSLVGASTAARWLLGAESVSAEEAQRAGFVDALAHEGTALDLALAWAERVASIDAAVTREQLALIRRSSDEHAKPSRARELRAFAKCWALPAHEEAVRRFFTERAQREPREASRPPEPR